MYTVQIYFMQLKKNAQGHDTAVMKCQFEIVLLCVVLSLFNTAKLNVLLLFVKCCFSDHALPPKGRLQVTERGKREPALVMWRSRRSCDISKWRKVNIARPPIFPDMTMV